MACLGLSQQFGVAGVTNFGFIIFQAAGGYTAAILALPAKSANGGFQSYILGWHLPFPLPWVGATIVGGVIALPFTFLVGRRLLRGPARNCSMRLSWASRWSCSLGTTS